MAPRREARERALGLCYETDIRGADAESVLGELPVPPERYAEELVRGVDAHRAELDEQIGRYAQRWTVERMPVIDRNLLRIGAYELAHRPDVPTGVVISEAVELAKSYSTPDSGRFVNGLLARLATVLRPGEAPLPLADLDAAAGLVPDGGAVDAAGVPAASVIDAAGLDELRAEGGVVVPVPSAAIVVEDHDDPV